MTVFFLLFIVFSFSFSQTLKKEIAKYELLKKFKEKKDVKVALFLIRNYPEAVFIDDLKVETAFLLLKEGDKKTAKKIARSINLKNVREELSDKAVFVWKELNLSKKEIVLRFPEKVIDLIPEVKLSEKEKEKVFKRLLRKGKFREVLELSDMCYYRGVSLYRLRNYEHALEEFINCDDERSRYYIPRILIKLNRIDEAVRFSIETDTNDVYLILIRYFLGRGNFKSAEKLLHYMEDSYEKYFLLGLINYHKGKLLLAVENLSRAKKFAEDDFKKSQVFFWKHKIFESIGVYDLSRKYLIKSAGGKGFYSVISRLKLNSGIYEGSILIVSGKEETGEFIREVHALGFPLYARKEAYRMFNSITPSDIVLISSFDPYLSIKLAVNKYGINSEVYKAVAFPVPFTEVVDKVSKKYKLDKSLIYAVMRQESLFDPFAVSPSNAKGLMQLLDSTARWIAKREKIKINDIFDVETNITLGSAYLRFLLDFWKGDLVKAIASYNAGHGAVKRWKDYEDKLFYIEMIPFRETRNYVKRVLWFYAVYSEKLGIPYREKLSEFSR